MLTFYFVEQIYGTVSGVDYMRRGGPVNRASPVGVYIYIYIYIYIYVIHM